MQADADELIATRVRGRPRGNRRLHVGPIDGPIRPDRHYRWRGRGERHRRRERTSPPERHGRRRGHHGARLQPPARMLQHRHDRAIGQRAPFLEPQSRILERVGCLEQEGDLCAPQHRTAVARSREIRFEQMTEILDFPHPRGPRRTLERVHHSKHPPGLLRVPGCALEQQQMLVELLHLLSQLLDEDREQPRRERVVTHPTPPRGRHASVAFTRGPARRPCPRGACPASRAPAPPTRSGAWR